MAKKISDITYDYSCFRILAYEYGNNKIKDSEKKIKAKLKYSELGPYDEIRVNNLRQLKDELVAEIRLYDRSEYYTGWKGEYSHPDDFDYKRMISDLAVKYNSIERKELESIVMLAIDLFHLR